MPPTPWFNYRKMTDSDLKAVYAYLRKIPSVRNSPPAYRSPGAGKRLHSLDLRCHVCITLTDRYRGMCQMMLTAGVIVLSSLGCNLYAQSSGWEVTTDDTTYHELSLVRVEGDSLIYEKRGDVIGHRTTGAIPCARIVRLYRSNASGALIGGAIAGVLTVAVAGATGSSSHGDQVIPPQVLVLSGGMLLTVAGMVVGNALDEGDDALDIGSLTPPQKRARLERLIYFDGLD